MDSRKKLLECIYILTNFNSFQGGLDFLVLSSTLADPLKAFLVPLWKDYKAFSHLTDKKTEVQFIHLIIPSYLNHINMSSMEARNINAITYIKNLAK